MSEITIKVQLDLSDAVKDFMASLMGGVTAHTPKQKSEQKSEQKAEPAPVVAPAPIPVAAPVTAPAPVEAPATPATESVASISREDIRALVKRIRKAEVDSGISPSGMIAILHKYGAKSVSDIQEADFVKITEELTNYLNTEIKPF